MSEINVPRPDVAAEPAGEALTAGQLLRQARQAQGLHIAALAAAIKVTPQKLELLENERIDELPDPTFARALALAVCRYLKIDPDPVLSRLPQPREHRLEHLNRGLATTFRERPGRYEPHEWKRIMRPGLLAPILVLIAALVVYMLPDHFWKLPSIGGDAGSSAPLADAAMPALSGTADRAADPSVVVETIHSAPGETRDATSSATVVAGSASAVTAATAPLTIRASGESWVEVVDSQGRTLVSRMLPAGESVALDGPPPLKLRIGNALGTQVMFKGQAVSLAEATKDNVARLELK